MKCPEMPQNLEMGRNGKDGANVENDTRESLIPDSPHSPQMGQILNKWGKIARGRITANGENKMGQTGKMGQKLRIPTLPECHRMQDPV